MILEANPPLPIVAKNIINQGDSPKNGGAYSLMKLVKFNGKDYGKSKITKNDLQDKFEFPDGVTCLKQVFTPVNLHLQLKPKLTSKIF